MVVILRMRVPAHAFSLGTLLPLPEGTTAELETLVSRGERSQPYLWVIAPEIEARLPVVTERAGEEVTVVELLEDRALLALDWDVEHGTLFSGVSRCEGRVLTASGDPESWTFEIRFPEHAALSRFGHHCEDHGIEFTVERVYSATHTTTDRSFGLTDRQREVLEFAVGEGYYAVPRRCATDHLATRFDISEQAVIERLRRGIVNLVSTTLLSPEREP